MRIAGVGRAFPPHYYHQGELLDALRRHWMREHFNPERLERLHKNVLVGGRHLALRIEEDEALESWGEANDTWLRVGLDIGARAIRHALARAGLEERDVDALFTVTVTGVATPSLDVRLMNRLALRDDVKRTPIFGLGCVAGAAGIARAADFVRAFPDQVAVLLSVELCSLTVQKQDLSIPNLVATGLFGDGAAAVVITGEKVRAGGPAIVATRSVFYRESERVMGWDISEKGFGIVLSADVPKMVSRHLRGDLDRFLAEHDLAIADIARWICHPGGPRVLTAMEEAFELPREAFELTWKSLAELGNLSSSSVLMVLGDTLEQPLPKAGSWGLLLAMGPGFCSELVLLRF